MRKSDFYEFLDGNIEHSSVFLDPVDKEKTKLMKIVSITRKPGGRVARIGLNITQPKPREIEIQISEEMARAIVKAFDEAPEEVPAGLTMAQEWAEEDAKKAEAAEATSASDETVLGGDLTPSGEVVRDEHAE